MTAAHPLRVALDLPLRTGESAAARLLLANLTAEGTAEPAVCATRVRLEKIA